MKACWDNAFQVVTKVPEYRHASYIEGIALYPCGALLEPGWLEVDGVVIDPTIPKDEFLYVACMKINGADALQEAVDCLPRPGGADKTSAFLLEWHRITAPQAGRSSVHHVLYRRLEARSPETAEAKVATRRSRS